MGDCQLPITLHQSRISPDLKNLILATLVFLYYSPTSPFKNVSKQPVHIMIPREGIFLDVLPSRSLKRFQHQWGHNFTQETEKSIWCPGVPEASSNTPGSQCPFPGYRITHKHRASLSRRLRGAEKGEQVLTHCNHQDHHHVKQHQFWNSPVDQEHGIHDPILLTMLGCGYITSTFSENIQGLQVSTLPEVAYLNSSRTRHWTSAFKAYDLSFHYPRGHSANPSCPLKCVQDHLNQEILPLCLT